MKLAILTGLASIAACSDEAPSTLPDASDPPSASPAPSIALALDCGTPSSVGVLTAGTDLQRVELDAATFPDARCNDGSRAVFYVRPAGTQAGRDRWVIQLQGGGGCRTADDCARRWCSVDTFLGMTHMTSTLTPQQGIRGEGVLARDQRNPFADANHVFIPYCSSDTHAGSNGAVDVDGHHPITGAPVRYRIEFNGHRIVEAVVATLRRDGVAPITYTLDGGAVELADLDGASEVMIDGASAGGGGVIHNVDRIRDRLPGARVAALIDSTFGPSNETLDWTTSTMCTERSKCDWAAVVVEASALIQRTGDESCTAWHAEHAPSTAYLCADTDHVLRNHVTTPMFVRQGLRDQLLSGNAVESKVTVPGRGLMTPALFSELVAAQLDDLTTIRETAEEGGAITTVPGRFGPPCPEHETLSEAGRTYGVRIDDGPAQLAMFDVLAGWRAGTGTTALVWRDGQAFRCSP